MIDVIIVSWGRDEKFRRMTQQAVDSAKKDEVNVIVVEQQKGVIYKGCMVLYYDFDFNYNRCLNLGLKECKGRYVALCNNDLKFEKNWSRNLIRVLEMGYDTVCPYCPRSHKWRGVEGGNWLYEGFRMGYEFIGWCIMGRRELFEDIGLNEKIEFWYSDNYMAEVLKFNKKKHALVGNSIVEHLDLGSKTLNSLEGKKKRELTSKQKRIFDKERRVLYAKRKRI